eukprot:sb/3466961/
MDCGPVSPFRKFPVQIISDKVFTFAAAESNQFKPIETLESTDCQPKQEQNMPGEQVVVSNSGTLINMSQQFSTASYCNSSSSSSCELTADSQLIDLPDTRPGSRMSSFLRHGTPPHLVSPLSSPRYNPGSFQSCTDRQCLNLFHNHNARIPVSRSPSPRSLPVSRSPSPRSLPVSRSPSPRVHDLGRRRSEEKGVLTGYGLQATLAVDPRLYSVRLNNAIPLFPELGEDMVSVDKVVEVWQRKGLKNPSDESVQLFLATVDDNSKGGQNQIKPQMLSLNLEELLSSNEECSDALREAAIGAFKSAITDIQYVSRG